MAKFADQVERITEGYQKLEDGTQKTGKVGQTYKKVENAL